MLLTKFHIIWPSGFRGKAVGGGGSGGSGSGSGGNRNRSQGWVDYNYDYEAAGLDKRQGSANRVSLTLIYDDPIIRCLHSQIALHVFVVLI
jgi:hypothetical protein